MTDIKYDEYKKALVEVEAALNCLYYDDYNKIPENIIELIANNKDESYFYEYNEDLDYEEWNFMPEAKAILYDIFKKYLATDEQKDYLNKREKFEKYKIEEEKKSIYNKDIFNRSEHFNNVTTPEKSSNNSLVKYKDSFILKLKKFIVRLFNIKEN